MFAFGPLWYLVWNDVLGTTFGVTHAWCLAPALRSHAPGPLSNATPLVAADPPSHRPPRRLDVAGRPRKCGRRMGLDHAGDREAAPRAGVGVSVDAGRHRAPRAPGVPLAPGRPAPLCSVACRAVAPRCDGAPVPRHRHGLAGALPGRLGRQPDHPPRAQPAGPAGGGGPALGRPAGRGGRVALRVDALAAHGGPALHAVADRPRGGRALGPRGRGAVGAGGLPGGGGPGGGGGQVLPGGRGAHARGIAGGAAVGRQPGAVDAPTGRLRRRQHRPPVGARAAFAPVPEPELARRHPRDGRHRPPRHPDGGPGGALPGVDGRAAPEARGSDARGCGR